jgi:hypothetical protein
MNPKDDDTSLGAILLQMGVITPSQLNIALEKQHNSTLEEQLGMVLVHVGFCTNQEVELALSAQASIRSSKDKEVTKACAAIDLAIQRKRHNGARRDAIMKGAQFTKRTSGTGYPAVTPELLAKGSNGR